MISRTARFAVGQVVRHSSPAFRGVVVDIDADFAKTEAWYDALPEAARPLKDQPFYHILAERDWKFYRAYASEQNLVADADGPVEHPEVGFLFGKFEDGRYPRSDLLN